MPSSFIDSDHYCRWVDMDTTDDYSVAMLDMANSNFRDHYTCSLPEDNRFFIYQDADARIYDAKFLEKVAFDYPQYRHHFETISPHDPSEIKLVYHAILDHHRQDEPRSQDSIVSVFSGSYEEGKTNMMEYDDDEDGSDVDGSDEDGSDEDGSDDEMFLSDTSSATSHEVYEDDEYDSDPDYVDSAYHRWLKTTVTQPARIPSKGVGSQASFGSCRSDPRDVKDPDYEDDVPALSPDASSSPESQYINTPNVSPTSTPHATIVEARKSPCPELSTLSCFPTAPVTATTVQSTKSYTVAPSGLIFASWGRENGRTCHPLSGGGFECSCSHRTASMGDMTRHWQSKRHSDAAFNCSACGKVYTREDALKRHLKRSDECGRKARRLAGAA